MKTIMVGAFALLLGGCSTAFLDSAESPKPGFTYVSGQDNAGPAVWLCPTSGHGTCQFVPVTVIE